jgi:WD40 repeat protein
MAGNIISGSSKNLVIKWTGSTIVAAYNHGKAESAFVYALETRPGNKGIISGSSDGTVVLWDIKMEKVYTISINEGDYRSLQPKVRSVCEHPDGRVLVGTRASEIIEFSNQGQSRKILNQGHFDFELWGLCEIPNEPSNYLTCGEDMLFAKWDVKTQKQVAKVQLKYQATTIDVNPANSNIAIGCKNGRVVIFDKSLNQLSEITGRTKAISVVKFSPDGAYLAVGGHDTRVFIYPALDNSWKSKASLTGHHSTILSIDFSKDSKVI